MVETQTILRAICPSCGQALTLGDTSDGVCKGCQMIDAEKLAEQSQVKKTKPKGPWKPRKRSWPNGRVYWIVGDGNGRFLCGKSGGESKFYDKDEAQRWADEHNKDA